MRKIYHCSFWKVFGEYWFVFILPAIFCGVVYFMFPRKPLFQMISILTFTPFLISILAVLTLLKTETWIGEDGITQKNFFKEKIIRWHDVVSIKNIQFYEPEGYLSKPKDLEIKSKDNTVIIIYRFLKDAEEAKKNVKYYSPKIFYETANNVLYKKIFNLHHSFLILFMFGIVIGLYFKLIYLGIISLILLILTFYYLKYVLNRLYVKIVFDKNDMIYEGAKLEGLLKVKRFTDTVPWQNIRSVKIIDDKKGPLKIETSLGDYLFWNAFLIEENTEMMEEINRRIIAKD